ncbi:MAG: hypothetical protein U1E36_00565 [Rickettsiales bacterium]
MDNVHFHPWKYDSNGNRIYAESLGFPRLEPFDPDKLPGEDNPNSSKEH